jgi:hypothetical protein
MASQPSSLHPSEHMRFYRYPGTDPQLKMTEPVSQPGTGEDAIYRNVKQDPFTVDIEQKALDNAHLMNDTVRNFAWQGITVVVKDHKTKKPKTILENIEGSVEAGTFEAFLYRESFL